jgi:hypothetical protein
MTDTDKYWMPTIDDDEFNVVDPDVNSRDLLIPTLPSEESLISRIPKSSASIHSRILLFLLLSSTVTVATVLVKHTVAKFDYLIACSLGLWLGWRF